MITDIVQTGIERHLEVLRAHLGKKILHGAEDVAAGGAQRTGDDIDGIQVDTISPIFRWAHQ